MADTVYLVEKLHGCWGDSVENELDCDAIWGLRFQDSPGVVIDRAIQKDMRPGFKNIAAGAERRRR